jgi:hypothetical protein
VALAIRVPDSRHALEEYRYTGRVSARSTPQSEDTHSQRHASHGVCTSTPRISDTASTAMEERWLRASDRLGCTGCTSLPLPVVRPRRPEGAGECPIGGAVTRRLWRGHYRPDRERDRARYTRASGVDWAVTEKTDGRSSDETRSGAPYCLPGRSSWACGGRGLHSPAPPPRPLGTPADSRS